MSEAKDQKKAAHRNEAAGFPFRQSHLPNRLGVSIEVIREAREHLEEGVDWKQQGQVVLFSASGVERLGERLRCIEQGTLSSEQVAAGGRIMGLLPERAGSLEAIVRMRVVAIPKNPHLVVCVPAESWPDGQRMPNGPRANVKVQSNVNFVLGMLIRATPAEAVGMFNLAGRCPRTRGRF